ncbi:tetratricopeptide repeat protein [Actinoplanes sp. NPDC051494]|uniref:tetratricopeptide repeat protein n=1 Tax=Actinoplanes sp. NPDC051494 TaxID=3363907 RepID=UPI0037925F68
MVLLKDLHSTRLRNAVDDPGLVIRVLLISRSTGGWLSAVSSRLEPQLELPEDAITDQVLTSLGEEAAVRESLFRDALSTFSEALRVDGADQLPSPSNLGDPEFAQVLGVHMAALVAVDDLIHQEPRSGSHVEVHRLSARLLRREAAYWYLLHHSGGNATTLESMRRTVYVATLTGARGKAVARTALTTADAARFPDSALQDHWKCYPAEKEDTFLEALHPDRLGEDLIGLLTPASTDHARNAEFPDDTWAATAADRLLTQEPQEWSGSALTVLVETARRWHHVAELVLFPLLRERPNLVLQAGGATLSRLVEIDSLDRPTLELIGGALPRQGHVDFDVAAASVSDRLTEMRLATTWEPAHRAEAHAEHGSRLHEAGRYAEALTAYLQAATIYAELELTTSRWVADQASLTRVMSTVCASLGRHDDALRYAQDAVRRRATAPYPVAVQSASDQARLSAALSDVGRYAEAVERSRQSIAELERSAGAGATSIDDPLAAALCRLGHDLNHLGRKEDAVEPTERAVGIYRRLADDRPGIYSADLARSQLNLGAFYSEVGRTREALASAEAAVTAYRRLWKANPARYLADLADALTNTGSFLGALGRPVDALQAADEAVDIYLDLVDQNPVAYLPGLARARMNLANKLQDVGRMQPALEAAEEAVAVYSRLAGYRPAVHRRDLAKALTNLGAIRIEAGLAREGVEPAEAAVRIGREMAGEDFLAFGGDLARALQNLASLLVQNGRTAPAADIAQEAVATYRRLVELIPAVHLPGLGVALNTATECLARTGRRAEALAAAEESVRIRTGLAAGNPAAHRAGLAKSLSNLSSRLTELGKVKKSIEPAQAAVDILRELATENPAGIRPALATSLTNLGASLAQVGRHSAALGPTREAIEIKRLLAAESPASYLPVLTTSLLNLSTMLKALNRRSEALVAARECLATTRLATFEHQLQSGVLIFDTISCYVDLCVRTRQELPEALAACDEAIGLLADLYHDDPAVFAPDLQRALLDQAEVLERMGDKKAAKDIRRQLG